MTLLLAFLMIDGDADAEYADAEYADAGYADAGSEYVEGEYTVIKQIGRGSFSKVYLCKYNDIRGSLPYESGFMDEFFIIKQIDLTVLMEKYRCKPTFTIVKRPVDSMNVNLTPYKAEDVLVMKESYEISHYFNRLQALVVSEIEVLRMLNHVNIIKFLDYFASNNVYSLQMEYCEGGDVHSLLKRGHEIPIVPFLKDISAAIEYMHDMNIIHRDIKPHNILLKGEVFKLTDFGFACYDVSMKDHESDWETMLCKKYYKVCGTPFYMAPELLTTMGDLKETPFYSRKVDIWSFGVCIFEVVSKCLPFLKRRVRSVNDLRKAFFDPNLQRDIWADINLNITQPLTKQIVTLMLQISPEQRIDICKVRALAFEQQGPTSMDLNDNAERVGKQSTDPPAQLDNSWIKVNASSSSLGAFIRGVGGVKGVGMFQGGFLDWLRKGV